MGGDRVGGRVNFLAPNVFEEHVSRDDGATVPEEVCKHHEFLPGQVDWRALQRDPVGSGIDSEVADLEHFFFDAKRRRKSARIRASSSSVAKGLARQSSAPALRNSALAAISNFSSRTRMGATPPLFLTSGQI